MTAKEFTREERYIVFKLKDATAAVSDQGLFELQLIGKAIDYHRVCQGKAPLEYVVVEKDWPEYELVWKMIEARMSGQEYALLLEPIATRLTEIERQRDDLASGMPDIFPAAHRLALELECLLLECKDTAAVSKWWDSAHEALGQWREFCHEDKAEAAGRNPFYEGRFDDETQEQAASRRASAIAKAKGGA